MTLLVARAASVAANMPFTLTVPAQYTWRLLSVCATVSRAIGGAPSRSYRLTITDGTSTLLASPASDSGVEPGTGTVTWMNATPAVVASTSTTVTTGPIPVPLLLPGYVITGTILGGVATDRWTAAAAWVDYASTG